MEIGRTSCTNFWANQFRVLMTAAAYVLMQELRLGLAGTAYAQAQVSSLRERFSKLGAQVVVSVRRIVLHLPRSFPYRKSFHRLALNLGRKAGKSPTSPIQTDNLSHSYSQYLAAPQDSAVDVTNTFRISLPAEQNSAFVASLLHRRKKFLAIPLFMNNVG
jgi:hypothetical protein